MAISYKAGNRITNDLNSREALVNGNPDLFNHYKFGGNVLDDVKTVILPFFKPIII